LAIAANIHTEIYKIRSVIPPGGERVNSANGSGTVCLRLNNTVSEFHRLSHTVGGDAESEDQRANNIVKLIPSYERTKGDIQKLMSSQ
jgi:hypothetical protein